MSTKVTPAPEPGTSSPGGSGPQRQGAPPLEGQTAEDQHSGDRRAEIGPLDPPRPTSARSRLPALPHLSRAEVQRQSRALLVPEWAEGAAQDRVRAATVLVVGAGGLGGPVIAGLAGAGVGRLRMADSDVVSVSNLHRQTLYTTADLGKNKAEVAAARAQLINPFVQVEVCPDLHAGNAGALLSGVTLALDCTDNFAARYLLADACVAAGLEWVWGAAAGWTGMVSVFGPHLGLRDVFPDQAGPAGQDGQVGSAEAEQSCDEVGVIGPVPNVVGSMMALEALKVLGATGEALRGRMWTLDGLSGRVRVLKLRPHTVPQT